MPNSRCHWHQLWNDLVTEESSQKLQLRFVLIKLPFQVQIYSQFFHAFYNAVFINWYNLLNFWISGHMKGHVKSASKTDFILPHDHVDREKERRSSVTGRVHNDFLEFSGNERLSPVHYISTGPSIHYWLRMIIYLSIQDLEATLGLIWIFIYQGSSHNFFLNKSFNWWTFQFR